MKSISIRESFVAAAAIALIAPIVAMAASFSNGSFESGTAPGSFMTVSSPASTTITNWTVSSGSVDYIGSYWMAADGSRSIDLNGNEAGTITQTFDTIPGATYQVTFALSGNPDNSASSTLMSPSNKVVRVSATGATSSDYSYDTVAMGNTLASMKWASSTYTFIATGSSTTLTFASQIAGAFGPAIDNVTITLTQQPPAPVDAECPSAPAVANQILKENNIKNKNGKYISSVAHEMDADGEFHGETPCDSNGDPSDDYRAEVGDYLKTLPGLSGITY